MNRWLSGNVFWPITERMLGRDTMARYGRLRRCEMLSLEQLRCVQNEKLRRLLRTVAAHCPFHAARFCEADLDLMDPSLGVDSLAALALLTRDDIRAHLAELSWMDCPGGARPYSTGGSSGEPLKFYFDRNRQATDWATRWRARSWWGVRPGDRELMLWGAPVELKAQDRLRIWRDGLLNQRLLSAFDMTAETMDGYIDVCRSFRPACVYGYPSSLALLARHARSRGFASGSLGSVRLQAVFVTGEVLAEADRLEIEDLFGAPAVIEYGCRDGGLLACGCREGLLHVPEEYVVLEVLDSDGRPVAPGETGEVVVTHLEAFATPMIRYRTGDLARLAPRGCRCGLNSMVLHEVVGRKTDQIVCRSDSGLRHMHALSLIYVLREAEGLRQFRIVQRSLEALDVEIVAGPGFTPGVEAATVRGLRERVGRQMRIRLIRRERLAPSPSGKHACVMSEVSLEAPLETAAG